MSFAIENFLAPSALRVIKRAGLHKVAGAMAGIPELTVKEAIATIGAKARLRTREVQKIAAGLEALAALQGEKTAANPVIGALLPHAATPALLGAAIGAGSELMNDGPVNTDRLLSRALAGGAIGGLGGMHAHLGRASAANPNAASAMADTIKRTL